MLCFLCGKKIGLFRSLVDQQYCCAAHRQESRLASAQAVRDEEELDLWAVSKSKKKAHRPGTGAGRTLHLCVSHGRRITGRRVDDAWTRARLRRFRRFHSNLA